MSPFSGAIAAAMLHDRISPQRLSSACLEALPHFSIATVVSARVRWMITLLFLSPERSDRMLFPGFGVYDVLSRPLVDFPAVPRRAGGLRDFRSSAGSAFPSISEYLSRFRDRLDGHRFNVILGVSHFCGRSILSGGSRELLAIAWRKRFCPICVRGVDII